MADSEMGASLWSNLGNVHVSLVSDVLEGLLPCSMLLTRSLRCDLGVALRCAHQDLGGEKQAQSPPIQSLPSLHTGAKVVFGHAVPIWPVWQNCLGRRGRRCTAVYLSLFLPCYSLVTLHLEPPSHNPRCISSAARTAGREVIAHASAVEHLDTL